MPGNAVSDLLRAEVSLVGVTVLLTMAALGFSCYSISHPRFTFRRLAAVLHLLTAVSTIAVIQLVDTSQVNWRQTRNSRVICNILIRKCLRACRLYRIFAILSLCDIGRNLQAY